jgi:hypothetical protein
LGARVLSTPVQRNLGCLATRAAMSALEMPRPARYARTVSGLVGDLRWESFVAALRACARVRPQVSTRYCSTANAGLGEGAAERSRWREETGWVVE